MPIFSLTERTGSSGRGSSSTTAAAVSMTVIVGTSSA